MNTNNRISKTCLSLAGIVLFFLPMIIGPAIGSPTFAAIVSVTGLLLTVVGAGKS